MLPLILQGGMAAPVPPVPPAGGPTATPEIATLSVENGRLHVSWSACADAESYRLLYGVQGERLSAISTSARSLVTPVLRENGRYQVTVECVDSLGNGIFGRSATVDVN